MGTGHGSADDERDPAADDERDPAADDDRTLAELPRQRVVRARGARRAQLTPAPGSDPAPEAATPGAHDEVERSATRPATPDDERITRERPPHW